MELLFIENEILEKIGNKLLPNENIEVSMLKHYKLDRYDINLYDVVGKLLIKHYYGESVEYDFSKIETFFKESTYLTIVTMFLETIDILLLNRIEHVDVINIVYDSFDTKGYYFRIIPRVYEED